MCTGIRIIRDLSASALATAWPIRHVGHTSKTGKPRRQSNFSTARFRPERALLDQVEERQALVAIILRDRDDQT